jgi:hypothetical protein
MVISLFPINFRQKTKTKKKNRKLKKLHRSDKNYILALAVHNILHRYHLLLVS